MKFLQILAAMWRLFKGGYMADFRPGVLEALTQLQADADARDLSVTEAVTAAAVAASTKAAADTATSKAAASKQALLDLISSVY